MAFGTAFRDESTRAHASLVEGARTGDSVAGLCGMAAMMLRRPGRPLVWRLQVTNSVVLSRSSRHLRRSGRHTVDGTRSIHQHEANLADGWLLRMHVHLQVYIAIRKQGQSFARTVELAPLADEVCVETTGVS